MKNKILITGASGLLGNNLIKYFSKNENKVIGLYNSNFISDENAELIKINILDYLELKNCINKFKPNIIIHCAGLTNVDKCEVDEKFAYKIHAEVSQNLASISLSSSIKFVHISTDHLWDGSKSMVEENEPLTPINVYGKTKAEAERLALLANPNSLIIRTNFFGKGLPWRKSISDIIIESLKSNKSFHGFQDVFFTPISINLLTKYINELINLNVSGIFHVVGSEKINKFEFATKVSKFLNLSDSLIKPASINDIKLMAPRPKDMSLSTKKITQLLGKIMPTVEESLKGIF